MLRAASILTRAVSLLAVASLMTATLELAAVPSAQAAVPLPSPVLSSPAEGETVSGNPVLGWSGVSGAVSYRVELSLDPGFVPLVSGFPVTTQELRYAPPAELPAGLLYWRVSALDATNTAGVAAAGSFQKAWGAAPNVRTPADDATLQFPTDPVLFSWDPLAGAVSYQLEIDDADDFIGAKSITTKNTSYVLTEPQTVNQVFYWRVRGASGSLYSDWSTPSTYRSVWPEAPTLLYPAAGQTGITDVYFDWDPIPGARTYQLQVSPNVDFANNITIDIAVKSTRYAPPDPLNNGGYYWRVRAMDAASPSNYGPWSAIWQFDRAWPDTPTILSPKNGASTSDADPADPTWQNPTFRWTPAKHAAWYRVRFATDSAMTTGLKECVTNRTTFTPYTFEDGVAREIAASCSFAFAAKTKYYWDVSALDAPVKNPGIDPSEQHLTGMIFGLRSPVQSFLYDPPAVTTGTTRQLDAADYLTPANCDPSADCSAEKDTPTFTWNAIPGATGYTIKVALDPNFTNVYRKYKAPYNRLTPRDSWRDNQAGQAYYWKVIPDGVSEVDAAYGVFQKRTKGVQRTAPAGGSLQADDFTFEWQDYLDTNQALQPPAVETAKSYRIQVSTVNDFGTLIDNQVVNTPFYTPYDKTYPEGPIYWQVQAIDGSKNELTVSTDDRANDPQLGMVVKKSPAPVLAFPRDGDAVTGVPYLQWAPLDFAASYEVQLDNDANFSSPISTPTTKMTAWAYPEPLAAGTYYWRVHRKDADGKVGAWSEARTFVLEPPPVTLATPANDASPAPSTLLLQWQPAQPSPKYRVELSTSPTFTSQLSGYPLDTVMSTWAPKTLLMNGTYYWRVKSLNALSTVVATSSPRSFTIDSLRPSVTSLTPGSGAAITSTFAVAFSEPVTGVDETSFTLVPSGTTTPVPATVNSPTPTSATLKPASRLVPGQTYTVNVSPAVTDRSGNALLPFTTSVRAATTVEENSDAVSRSWARWSTASASGGAMKLSQRSGTTLTVPFNGTSIAVQGYQGTSGGYAAMSLDGTPAGTASFFSSTAKYGATIWLTEGLSNGPHTLVITVSGTRPAASKGTWVYIDGFRVDGSVLEENVGEVTDNFSRVATSKASGSAYEVTDYRTGTGRSAPVLTFQFKGTGISWYGTKGTKYGKGAVYIDGSKKATIDLYASSTWYRQKLWSSTTLSNGIHTIKVVPSGSKRSSAKGYDVSADYFTVR